MEERERSNAKHIPPSVEEREKRDTQHEQA